jgi:hypothetical protein
MTDPFGISRVETNIGAAFSARGSDPRWELAEVLIYKAGTHTCDIRTHSGRSLNDVPQIKQGANDYELLRTGQTIVINYDLGFPAIVGCINIGSLYDKLLRPSITGVETIGENNPYLPTQGTANCKPPNAPTDLTGGDWAKCGTYDNHIAILEGGVTSFGCPTALIRSLALKGILQINANKMHTITDFGEWKVENKGGATSFILRAGSNQATQTGVDEQHWSIRLDLGAEGNLFNFEITEPGGRSVFKFYVSPDGRVEIYGDGGVDVSSGSNGTEQMLHDIAGARDTNIVGHDDTTIGGDRIYSVTGSSQEDVGTDKVTTVGGQCTHHVNDTEVRSVGGDRVEIIAGGSPLSLGSGHTAVDTRILNGGWMVDIGNPKQGANITAMAAYHLRTSLGDVTLESGGAMQLKAEQVLDVDAKEVHLNGDAQHAVRGDAWRGVYNRFVGQYNKFIDAFKNHKHPGPNGTTGKPLPSGPGGSARKNPWWRPGGVPAFPGDPATGCPWIGEKYVCDESVQQASLGTTWPVPPQPVAPSVGHTIDMPEGNLSRTVKLT